jgi:nitrogen regulatory protein PII-like uncharacterized protein
MSAPDYFIRDINALNVPAPLLGEVMIMWASLSPDEWKNFDRRLERVVEIICKKDRSEENLMLAMAVTLRLMALDSMVVDSEIRGWLMPGRSSSGITYLHGDLLKAAAEEVILEGPNGEPTFARTSFRARLMALAATRGSA